MEGSREVLLPAADLSGLRVGDRVVVRGRVLCGRDAALPRACRLIAEGRAGELGAPLEGAAVLHTAVSCAGIGPTSSNKVEIEESFGPLCEAGVKVFLGKGEISPETVALLGDFGAVFAVVPPVTALLSRDMRSKRCVAFPELGMEALWKVELDACPAIVAAAGGESLFGKGGRR